MWATPFLVEIKKAKKKSTMARLCRTAEHVTAIDEEYFAAACDCAVGVPYQDNRLSPIVWKDEDEERITIVSPIRIQSEYLDALKELAAQHS